MVEDFVAKKREEVITTVENSFELRVLKGKAMYLCLLLFCSRGVCFLHIHIYKRYFFMKRKEIFHKQWKDLEDTNESGHQ